MCRREPGFEPFGLFRWQRWFDRGKVIADRSVIGAFVIRSVEDGLEVQRDIRIAWQ